MITCGNLTNVRFKALLLHQYRQLTDFIVCPASASFFKDQSLYSGLAVRSLSFFLFIITAVR